MTARKQLFKLYGEIINHPRTSDELRRATEAKLLSLLHSYLLSVPASEKNITLKDQLRRQVQDLAEGAVLLEVPDPLAWLFVLEGKDFDSLG